MGMDYVWSGSASYPRFRREQEEIAKIFGGVLTFFTDKPRFAFSKETNPILVRWFQEPYGSFTEEETKTIWALVSVHPEIEEISWQIWNELKTCCELDSCWYIY